MHDSFRLNQLDSKKLRASDNTDMIGRKYMHSRTHRLFTVNHFVWMGNTDEWGVAHSRSGTETMFVRSLINFNGNHEDGTRRFIQIKED